MIFNFVFNHRKLRALLTAHYVRNLFASLVPFYPLSSPEGKEADVDPGTGVGM